MSYILDALKKAERERKLGNVPSIDATLDTATRLSQGSRWPTIIAAAMIANAAVLGALYLYWQQQPESGSVWPLAESGALSPPPPSASPAKPAARPLEPVPPPVTPPAPSPSPSRLQTAAVDGGPQTAGESLPALQARPESARDRGPKQEPGQLPSRQPADKPVAESQAVANSESEAPLPPLLEDLPAAYRSVVPPLDLTVHVYSDTPSQRFVFLNNRRYGEGQDTEEGARIERIQPRGTVLSFQGRQFFLPGRW